MVLDKRLDLGIHGRPIKPHHEQLAQTSGARDQHDVSLHQRIIASPQLTCPGCPIPGTAYRRLWPCVRSSAERDSGQASVQAPRQTGFKQATKAQNRIISGSEGADSTARDRGDGEVW
jgi:hypothetical protein